MNKLLATGASLAALACTTAFGQFVTLVDNMPANPGNVNAQFAIDGVYGYAFTTGESPLRITALGFYDYLDNGLLTEHTIGLWSDTGDLLLSGTVGPGMADFEAGSFDWVNVTKIDLMPMTTYVLGATYDRGTDTDFNAYVNDRFSLRPSQATFFDDATYLAGRFMPNDGSLAFPAMTAPFAFGGYIGPNLQMIVVPEPGQIAGIALAALLGLLVLRRRFHR